VNHLVRPWRRPVARVLVLALALGTVPVSCLAGQPPVSPPSASKLAASIDKAVQHEVAQFSKTSPSAARQASATAPSAGSRFFKSRAGIITAVLLAAGTGLALYSTSHDRVKSPEVPYGGTWK
jgi:hypothetical protein